MMEPYTPEIIEDGFTTYAVMLVEIETCPACERYMVPNISKYHRDNIFPTHTNNDLDAQVRRAGWVFESKMLSYMGGFEPSYLCVECAESGEAAFVCQLCEEEKESDKAQAWFGDPAEILCTDCFESVPAKQWKRKVDELREAHKYDFY